MAVAFAESNGEIMGSGDDGVICGCGGHSELMREPVDGVDDSSGIGGWCPNAETAVMLEAGADVVASNCMDSEGFASVSRFVGKDFNTGWSDGCFIKIEMAMYLGMSGETGVYARRSKEIQSKDCLW